MRKQAEVSVGRIWEKLLNGLESIDSCDFGPGGRGRGIGALRERSLVARAVWRRDAFERFD